MALPTSTATSQADFMKCMSLIIYTFHNAAVTLAIRYVRVRSGPMFLASASVVVGELVKLAVCLVLLVYEHDWNVLSASIELRDKVLRQPIDTLKVALLSLIYTIQNNLMYLSLSNLDAATFQVTYQLKIFTTVIFSIFMLSKPVSRVQWLSLGLLFVGVSIAQTSNVNYSPSPSTPVAKSAPEQNYALGMAAVLVTCILSGFAGVYFEKILKTTNLSVWTRNIQLAALSIPLGFITAFITDGSDIVSNGFFFGFDLAVWVVILLQSVAGLLVAVVIKYADNILKGFATAVAILLACLLTWAIFSTHLTAMFSFGAFLVAASVFLYSSYPPTVNKSPIPLTASKLEIKEKNEFDTDKSSDVASILVHTR